MSARNNRKYAIIDIETTGGLYKRDKIIEIAIVIHDGSKIVDQFETLVNPERSIPPEITRITGITNEMVRDAPKFYEIARNIIELTEGTVFVAHNVRFDYSFIKEEFKSLGYTYTRKQLCTVKLSRTCFPGLRSYSLGNLIKHFIIHVNNRHRALDDALATADIFTRINRLEFSPGNFNTLINHGIQESQLPKYLDFDKLHELPEETGVYYFHNRHGDIIYVGKAIDIKARVFQHFRKVSNKAAILYQRVHDVSYEVTGSELVALLLEAKEIKEKHPEINKAHKKKHFQYFLTSVEDAEGYMCFDICKLNEKSNSGLPRLSEYTKLKYARNHLLQLIEENSLCPKRSFFKCTNQLVCHCMGTCTLASQEDHNGKVIEAAEKIRHLFPEDFILLDDGRTLGEKAVISIEDGKYRGFGYVTKDELDGNPETLSDAVRPVSYHSIMNKLIWNQMKVKNYSIIKIKHL